MRSLRSPFGQSRRTSGTNGIFSPCSAASFSPLTDIPERPSSMGENYGLGRAWWPFRIFNQLVSEANVQSDCYLICRNLNSGSHNSFHHDAPHRNPLIVNY